MAGQVLFLSYNGADRPAVSMVNRRLEEAGLRTFFDQQDLGPGMPWPRALEDGLRDAAGVAVFLGPSGLGGWQQREIDLALDWQTRALADNRRLPVVPVLLPGFRDPLPGFLLHNSWVDLTGGLDDGAALDRLVSALRGEEVDEADAREIAVCPFRGLESFREEDVAFFFGREAVVERLVERVREHRLVVIAGPSGNGKSSLVQAGLIPRLRRQRDPLWGILSIHPGADPYQQLAQALYPVIEPQADVVTRLRKTKELADNLRSGEISLASLVEEILAQGKGSERLLLVVDQLEELFTTERPDRNLARAFVEDLLAARESVRPRLTLILTLRADFYGHALALSREWSDQVERRILNLGRMSPDERRRAIEKPAERVGLRFAPGLVERILEQVHDEPGELPLLEYALRELWERRSREGTLTHEAFDGIGGVRGAISRRADAELSRLSEEEKKAARRLLLGMVRVPQSRVEESYTRQQVLLSGLTGAQRQIVESFVGAKLLVASSEITEEADAWEPGTVTLAHEALIETWASLRDWLDEDADFLRWRQRVAADSAEWEQKGRARGFLLPEARLAEAERWLGERGDDLGPGLKDFLMASRQARVWRARVRTAFLALLVSVAVFALFGWYRAEIQERSAVARQLTAQAELVRSERADQLDLSVLLGVEALRRFQALGMTSLEADKVLRRGLTLLPLPITPALKHRDQGRLLCLVFSRDGRVLVTAGQDGTARLWDTTSGQTIGSMSHKAPVAAVALSPDGRMLATAGQDGTARLWQDGREIIPPLVHRGALTALAFSPDGTWLATASVDRTARVWETGSGREVASFRHGDEVSSVVFDRDGRSILTASADGATRLWDIVSGHQVLLLPHARSVVTAAFSPDGRSVATACKDGAAYIWEAATGRQLWRLGHDQPVSAVAFDPRGGSLATGGQDGTARLWDLQTGREVARLSHEGALTAVAFSPDGRYLGTASKDNTARIWSTGTGRELVRVAHQGIVYAIAFRGDGSAFATASLDKTARIWRTPAGSRLGPLPHSHWVRDAAFSPASGSLVTAAFDGTILLWRLPGPAVPAAGWMPVRRFVHPAAVLSAAVSPDGRWIASGGFDGSVRLWDVSTGREAVRFAHQDGVEAIAFHPDGRRLATASYDHTVRLWSAVTGEELARLPHPGAVYDLAFGRDGTLLATACQDGLLRLWRTEGGRLLQTVGSAGRRRPVIRAVAFDPDGRFLAVGGDDKVLRVWRVSRDRLTGERILASAHARGVYDLAFGPRGKYLAAAGGDGTVRLWDLATGEQVSQMQHAERVNALAFSLDGRSLATASEDQTVRIWPVLPDDLIAEACARVSPHFTPDGWQRYFGAEPFHDICPAKKDDYFHSPSRKKPDQ